MLFFLESLCLLGTERIGYHDSVQQTIEAAVVGFQGEPMKCVVSLISSWKLEKFIFTSNVI